MVFADAIDVEAELVGELDLLHQVAESLTRPDLLPGGGVERGFRKGVQPEFHGAWKMSRKVIRLAGNFVPRHRQKENRPAECIGRPVRCYRCDEGATAEPTTLALCKCALHSARIAKLFDMTHLMAV